MDMRNYQIRSLSWLSSILLLLVLVLLNAAFSRAGVRVDLTEEGKFTLADGSQAVLAKLEDPAVVKVFWHNVPLKFDNHRRYVQALLEEMQAEVGDRFQVQWVDMDEDEGQTMASELGVEEWIFSAEHGSEVRQSKGHMSLTIELGNEPPAVFNALSNIEAQLEYLIIATISQRMRADPPVIGFIAQKPPFNPFAGAQRSPYNDFEQEALKKAFGKSARTYLTLDEPIPEDVTVLIVVAPRDLTEEKVYRIEQYMLRGGRVILLLDPVDVETVFGRGGPMGGGTDPHSSGMEDWLGHLGVTVESGVVGDFAARCRAPLRGELVWYPYWPRIEPEFMERENVVMRNLAPMPLYWPAALSVDERKQEQEGRTVTVLGRSSEEGYRRGDITGLARAIETSSGKALEQVPLVVMIEGPLKSFWLGKPVPGSKPPEPEKPEGDDDEGAEGEKKDGESAGGEDDGEAKDEAVGSPDGDEEKPGDAAPAKDDEGDPPAEAEDDPPAEAEDDPPAAPKEEAASEDEPKPAPAEGDEEDGDDDEGEDEESGDEEETPEEQGPERLEDGSIRLIVVGDAEMISDQFGPWNRQLLGGINRLNGVGGFNFVVSAADWLSGSDDLLALRARATNPRNLDQIEKDEQSLVKYLNLLLVPLLILLTGITVFFVRRS